MKTITFRDELAHGVYHSMIEGMAEIAEDDRDEVLFLNYQDLLWFTGQSCEVQPEDVVYPVTYPLPDHLIETAERVFENCADNNDRYYVPEERDEEGGEPDIYIYSGDVVIADSPADEPEVAGEHGFRDDAPLF